MQLFIWRHSKRFSSWSMLDEPHIHRDNYLEAEVTVLAASLEQALAILQQQEEWQVEELRHITPQVIALDQAGIVNSQIRCQ